MRTILRFAVGIIMSVLVILSAAYLTAVALQIRAALSGERPDYFLESFFPVPQAEEERLQTYLDRICEKRGYCGFKVKLFRWFFYESASPAFVTRNHRLRVIYVRVVSLPYFTEKEWQAILLHEIGHIRNKSDDEVAADRFAACTDGKENITAVREKLMKRYGRNTEIKEAMQNRIFALRTLILAEPACARFNLTQP